MPRPSLDEVFLLSTVCAPSVNGFNPLYCKFNVASMLVDERDALQIASVLPSLNEHTPSNAVM